MIPTAFVALFFSLLVANAHPGASLPRHLTKRDTSVSFDGRTFVNHGLVGFVSQAARSVYHRLFLMSSPFLFPGTGPHQRQCSG